MWKHYAMYGMLMMEQDGALNYAIPSHTLREITPTTQLYNFV